MLEVFESKHRDAWMNTKVFLCEAMVVLRVSQKFRFLGRKALKLTAHKFLVLFLENSITLGQSIYFLPYSLALVLEKNPIIQDQSHAPSPLSHLVENDGEG